MYAVCVKCGNEIGSGAAIKRFEMFFCSTHCVKEHKKNMPKLETGLELKGCKIVSLYSQNDNMGAKRYYANLLCDCGKTFEQRRDYVNKQLMTNKVLSCGCKKVLHVGGKKSPLWSGHEDISGSYFSGIRCKSKTKNIEFDITIEYIWGIFIAQNKRCVYSGQELCFKTSIRVNPIQTASLDRIDSSKGYVEGNVQWVHKTINYMKRSLSDPDFIELCNLVSNNQ